MTKVFLKEAAEPIDVLGGRNPFTLPLVVLAAAGVLAFTLRRLHLP